MKKKILINTLILMFVVIFFGAKPKPASAGEVFGVILADPFTGLVFADAVTCGINVIWGCDKDTGASIDPCAFSGTNTAEWYPGDTSELCTVGTVEVINYFDDPTKPLEWKCNLGSNSKTCTAYVQPEAGRCSSRVQGKYFYNLPGYRCRRGETGPITESETDWKWTCFATGPGVPDASCTAYKKFKAECGSAAGQTFPEAPSDNLCAANNSIYQTPKYVAAYDAYDYCEVNGPAYYGSVEDCYIDYEGDINVPASPAHWEWSCQRGSTYLEKSYISCKALAGAAAPVAGSCGSSNGQSFVSTPTTNLCADGSVPTVNGSGPWSWTCLGQNGGTNADCSAQKTCTPNYNYGCTKLNTGENCNNSANCEKAIVTEQAYCVVSDNNNCNLPLPSVSLQDCANNGVTCESITETCPSCTKNIDSWKEVNP